MGSIDQNEFTIKCEIEGIVDKIFPDNLKISEEISELYTGRTLIFIKKNSLNLKNLLSKSIFFEISLKQKKRTFYGIITQIESLEKFEKKDILYDSYMIFFSHPLFKLTLTKNSRIFQNKNLETIISEIFAKNKLQIDKTFNIVGEFSKSNIEYCIQYEESDFQFISRLMEHYGVFYFFNYQGSKNNPPKIIISNTSNKYINFIQDYQIPMDYGTNIDKSPIAKMQIFREKTKLENISYTTNSYNFESPNNNLETMKNDGNLGEYYEWNSYNNKDTGKIIAKLRTGNKENSVETYYGESMYPFLSVGYFFKLEKNYIDAINKEYVVTKISHFFNNTAWNGGIVAEYINKLECIEKSKIFIPKIKTSKPKIYGNLLGIVTGPKNKSVYRDKFNRIKVKLFWDKESKDDENSSCWIRVAEFLSGSGFGSQFTPRVGNEVIVGFFNGDPDQPYVIGTLYNEKNKPPFSDANSTVSGIRTRSIDQNTDGYNEISFDDKGGNEKLFIHAEKDLEEEINHSKKIRIEKGNLEIELKEGSYNTEVKKGEYKIIVADEIIIKAKKITFKSSDDTKFDIGGNLDINVKKKLNISSASNIDISSTSGIKIKSNSFVKISSATNMDIKSSTTMDVSAMNYHLKTSMNLTIKSSLNTTISSSVAMTLKSSAINKVSGSMVMLG